MVLPFFLVQLAGAAFLLLYGVRLVQTSVERATGPNLRQFLITNTKQRIPAAIAGGMITVLLQSATATTILAVGFISAGLISFTGGLAIVLGADFGSAIVVQLLSFRPDWLIPLFLAVGGWLYLKFHIITAGQIGRALLGIAFILISLQMISQASTPMHESTLLSLIASYLQKDMATAFILGASTAFIMHSSVAAILLYVTLVSQKIIPIEVGGALVLGANLGAAFFANLADQNHPID